MLRSDLVRVALPHIERRPLTLVRCHPAITRDDTPRSARKFLRHAAASQPRFDGVPRINIPEQRKVGEYRYVARSAIAATLRSDPCAATGRVRKR